jgi:DNA-binding transcriptional ArsR family regulator
MVKFSQAGLDASFAALSDATRRAVLERLGRSDASITDLAEKFQMTLAGMMKHVGVLEEAGLVTTEKVGRVRTCKLGARRLEEEMAWLERHRRLDAESLGKAGRRGQLPQSRCCTMRLRNPRHKPRINAAGVFGS